ncbi:hypothetical protein [Streptomyces hyaluromycini]|uniref:hypothetical protein n=1 Tax=Streptomyces hyaluromycini TaxID=1377993 RepID=UPI0015827F2C|nr:hypothetical protein [Streptomyces hyaluromycini]
MSVEVAVVREADDESVEALARLLPQLSSTAGPLDRGAVRALLSSDANTVGLDARDSRVYRFVLRR